MREETRLAKCRGVLMGQLTPRELEVWQLLAQRLTNQEISQVLGIRVRTTEHHVGQIMAKLGVANRRQVIIAMPARHPGNGFLRLAGDALMPGHLPCPCCGRRNQTEESATDAPSRLR